MKDIYVLKWDAAIGGGIIRISDDSEYLNMYSAKFNAVQQSQMHIENHDLYESEEDCQ